MKIDSKFAVGDKVHADGCNSLTLVVTAVIWRHPKVVNYEVSWISNSDAKSVSIEEWRLQLVGEK